MFHLEWMLPMQDLTLDLSMTFVGFYHAPICFSTIGQILPQMVRASGESDYSRDLGPSLQGRSYVLAMAKDSGKHIQYPSEKMRNTKHHFAFTGRDVVSERLSEVQSKNSSAQTIRDTRV